LAGPSFQEGRGSVSAHVGDVRANMIASPSAKRETLDIAFSGVDTL
jgi:hypothetical protein